MILQSRNTDTRAGQAGGNDSEQLPVPIVIGPVAHPEALDIRAQRLFASLPYAYRLSMTRQRFPHVLNQIAAEWDVPRRFLDLMDRLFVDQRGDRQGFPFETILELTNLRDYYLNEVKIGYRDSLNIRRTVW